MTAPFPELKTGLRLGIASAAVTGALAMVLLAALPVRAQDANPVLATVNGAEIRQSDLTLAEEELGPSLAQMDPSTKRENVLAFLIDMKIVAKAAEDKKVENNEDFKKRLAFRAQPAADGQPAGERGQGRDHRRGHEEGLRGGFQADHRRGWKSAPAISWSSPRTTPRRSPPS